MRQSILIFPLLLLSVFLSHRTIGQEDNCRFFGLSVPGTTPKIFDPEVMRQKSGFRFNLKIRSCNEVYFTTLDTQENIYGVRHQNGKWTQPQIASFSDPAYSDADPFLSVAGDRIYFISTRPTNKYDTKLDWNIWSATRENGIWSDPEPLPTPINTDDSDEYFFSVSDNGNAFFSSNRSGGEGSFDICMVKVLGNGQFSNPVNGGRPLSSEKYEFDPYISPDEKFIVFSINENGNSSLYYSYKDRLNQWTEPQKLNDEVNITRQDFAPSLSADGKYLFYSNNGQLKRVSTDILKIPE